MKVLPLHRFYKNKKKQEMKKMITLLALVMTCQLAFCQTYQDFFNKYKDAQGVEYIEVPQELLKMGAAQADAETKAVLERVESIYMLQVANPSEELSAEMLAEAKKLSQRYDKLADGEEDGETMLIYGDGEDGDHYNLLFVLHGNAEAMQIIAMKGKISMKELEKLSTMTGN